MLLEKVGEFVLCGLWAPFVTDIAIFVLKRDVKLQLTNLWAPCGLQREVTHCVWVECKTKSVMSSEQWLYCEHSWLDESTTCCVCL